MFKVSVTNAVVSQGFKGAQAIQHSQSGDVVYFRIGLRVYDKRAENNTRWVNRNVKVFNKALIERIEKMKLDGGGCINLIGREDDDSWTDKETGEIITRPVIILEEIEYVMQGNGKNKAEDAQSQSAPAESAETAPTPTEELPGNAGYEPLGGSNPFFQM